MSTDGETRYELPDGWEWVKLDKVCEVNKDNLNIISDTEYNYIDISSVENGTGRMNLNNSISGKNLPSRAKRRIKIGDILLSTVRPNLKAFVHLKKLPQNPIVSTGFAVLSPKEALDSGWIYQLLFTTILQNQMIAQMGKSAYPSINQNDVKNLEIPLPSLAEQQRIIATLDKQLAAVAQAEQAATDQLEAVRALSAAYLREILPNSEGELPDGWALEGFTNLVKSITPPQKIKTSLFGKKGKYPIIDQSQQEIAGWTNDENILIQSDKELVIFGDHTCAIKIVTPPFAQGADGIKILHTNGTLIPKFLYYALKNAPIATKQYTRHFSRLKKTKILYPTQLNEQQRIVAILDKQLAAATQAEQATKEQLEAIQALKPSLLRRAFAGELQQYD